MTKSLFILFTICFIAIRARFHQPEREKQKEIAPSREKYLASQFSLALFSVHGWWLSQPLMDDTWYILTILGALLMGLSLPLLYWVHHSLGVFFSARLVLQEEHIIIQHGPYKWVRHPMYSVGFLYLIGAGLLSQSWIVGTIPTMSFALLVWLRIRDEEAMLSDLSEEYQTYTTKTGRFFPKL